MRKISSLVCAAVLFFTLNACEHAELELLNELESNETLLNAKGPPSSTSVATFITLATDDNVDYCMDANENTAVTFPLWAGQHMDAGTVTIGNDEEYLYVSIQSTAGFQDVEDNVKMWLGTDISELPTNKKGTPIPGKFPYKYTVSSGDTSLTFKILLTDINYWSTTEGACSQELSIVVHGDVLTTAGDATSGETAFAGNTPGDGPRWWYLMDYTTVCCEDIPEEPTTRCETAFAFGNTCFIDLGFNRWGWTNGPLSPGVFTYDIYAGAGQCDTSKGALVGTLTLTYDGANAQVTFSMNPGYTMSETHLYIGNENLPTKNGTPTVAPGLYGNIHDLNNATSDTFTITGLSGDIYIVAHAVVCFIEVP